MNARFQGRVVIVTGASGGIGRAAAERFAKEGASVVAVDLPSSDVAKLVSSLEAAGAPALAVHADVTDADAVRGYVAQAVKRFGGVDALFNNAGIEGAVAPIEEYPDDLFDKVLAVNVRGVFLGMKYALPVMVEQRSGVILNTASTVGCNAIPGLPAYTASKAGVIQLSKTAAIEYADKHIRVNAICPAVVDTPLVRALIDASPDPEAVRRGFETMNPMPGMVTADAVANAALFLVSDEAAFITAVALPIDGGYTAR